VLLDAARESYAEAVAQEPIQRLQIVEHIAASAKETARRANYEADKMIRADKGILPLPVGERSASPVAHLSDSEKASLVSEIGAAGFQAVIKSEMALPPAYWPEADKTDFAEKHGGEAWEGYLAGTWTPPADKAPAPVDPWPSLGPPA
jgi:hypothetical protein